MPSTLSLRSKAATLVVSSAHGWLARRHAAGFVHGHVRGDAIGTGGAPGREMSGALRLWLRVGLCCLPQLALGAIAILAFVGTGMVASTAAGPHLAGLAAGLVLYFTVWGAIARRAPKPPRTAFGLTTFALTVLLNGVYAASYSSYRLWGAYISWDNLRALQPHLRGFSLALGPAFVVSVGLLLGTLLVLLGLHLAVARRTLRHLATAFAAPRAVLQCGLLAAFCAALALFLWQRDPHWRQFADHDPQVAFWSGSAMPVTPPTTAMLAERTAGAAYAPPADFQRRNVIIIAIDCLRADHLSFNGYARETMPFLASLAQAGRLHAVRFALANGNNSPPGIRSILNSHTPPHQHLVNFRLADVLKRAGYRTHIIGTGDHTTLGDMRAHYGPNIDVFRDGLSDPTFSVNDDRGLLRSLAALPPAGAEPAFFYLHLMSAHELGVREDRFQRWQPAQRHLDWAPLFGGAVDAATVRNTYDNGLLQADDTLREIFTLLAAKGYLRDYVAAIAGDHGQALGERGHFGHSQSLFAEDVNIPILFLESGAADYGPLPFGSQVDIAPTLLARLGLPAPATWEGRSLYRAAPPDTVALADVHENRWHGLVRRRDDSIFKYVFEGRSRVSFIEHLFDERLDPAEQHDLAADPTQRELLLELRRLAAKEFLRPLPPAH